MKVLSKKRESLGEAQSILKRATKNLRNAERAFDAARERLFRSKAQHDKIMKELDDTYHSVRNANQ